MGASSSFGMEEYAGRRRSSGFPDNLGVALPAGEPAGLGSGPEFIRTTLPTSAIRQSLGRTTPLPEEKEIQEIPAGSTQSVRVGSGGPSQGSLSVGDQAEAIFQMKSFYRTNLPRLGTGASIPVGHLHTSLLEPSNGGAVISDQQFQDARNSYSRMGVIDDYNTCHCRHPSQSDGGQEKLFLEFRASFYNRWPSCRID
ncbi:hypothetical protein [Candidatus Nitrososphaera gargensis]|nr:hypothetical protein [Candidatus Nitrososphaera gargensis]